MEKGREGEKERNVGIERKEKRRDTIGAWDRVDKGERESGERREARGRKRK